MRFVPVQSIKEGTILKNTIFSTSGQILLREGIALKEVYIKQLIEHGFNGIYIEDDLSKNIEIENVISDKLKNEAVMKIKGAFNFAQKKDPTVKEAMATSQGLQDMIDSVIDEILSNKNFMVNMIDLKVFDDYTFYHCVNVATISIILGINMGMNKIELSQLGIAALLHDIGKVFTPKDILNKPGKFQDNEWEIMKKHSEEGYTYLKDKFNVHAKSYLGVLQHHEKWDGSGYPHGVKGESISLYARIISIVDIYDALTSDRPYRKALLPSEAMEYIMGGGGSSFDPKIVQYFTRSVAPYPDGTIVILSNHTKGIVIENIAGKGLRPVIKIFEKDEVSIPEYVLDLGGMEHRNITIVGIAQM